MLRTVVASAVVASAAAFSAPSAFMGKGLNTQAATRSCGMTMAMETEGVSRRAALGAILAGAAALPVNAEVLTSFGKNQQADPNAQLRIGGVGMTSVQGTGQTGIRTSAFKKAVLGNAKNAQSFPRDGMNPEQIGAIERLTQKTMENSAIDKSGIKTFEGKLGINPAFGGSSGIMTGAK